MGSKDVICRIYAIDMICKFKVLLCQLVQFENGLKNRSKNSISLFLNSFYGFLLRSIPFDMFKSRSQKYITVKTKFLSVSHLCLQECKIRVAFLWQKVCQNLFSHQNRFKIHIRWSRWFNYQYVFWIFFFQSVSHSSLI